MENRKTNDYGWNIKRIGGMVLCVAISCLVLVFGKHDTESVFELPVDASWEAWDGDLDLGNGLKPSPLPGQDNADSGSVGEEQSKPGAGPGNNMIAGTEEAPLWLQDEQFQYQIVQGIATVAERLTENVEEVVIPQEIEGYPVEVIGEYLFQDCSTLKQVTIPEGITEIRWNAFENCVALESVEIPSSVHTIRECAFWNTGLTSVTVSDSVRVLEDYAFFGCENLTELTLATTSNLSSVFDMSIVTTVNLMEGVTVIDEDAFSSAQSLTSVNLPSTLAMIKAYAFWECTALESIQLPDSVVSIGANAFENCYELREVKMSEGLLLLSEYAFYSCWALEELVIPEGITTIQDAVFDDCENLVLIVGAESTGEEYAIENDLAYEIR